MVVAKPQNSLKEPQSRYGNCSYNGGRGSGGTAAGAVRRVLATTRLEICYVITLSAPSSPSPFPLSFAQHTTIFAPFIHGLHQGLETAGIAGPPVLAQDTVK